MAKARDPDWTREQVLDVLNYDPDTGVFTWKKDTKLYRAGQVAGAYTHYVKIYVFGRYIYAHRLAWLVMSGSWPAAEIDHVDRDPVNNAFTNLRPATRGENARNRAGAKGYFFDPVSGRWKGQIVLRKKKFHLGLFRTEEEARAAYLRAAADVHGDFAGVRS